jgi:hypothetical protein
MDQVSEHLLAGVKGLNSVIAGGTLFCYGVGNDLPGRAQYGVGVIPLIARRGFSRQ